MRIDIHASGFDLTEGLREHTRRRLEFALDHVRPDAGKVSVHLSDINGPRGGNDKRCRIHIPLPRSRDVVIEDTEADLYVAIDRAVERASQTLDRRLSKRRTRAFSHERPQLAEPAAA